MLVGTPLFEEEAGSGMVPTKHVDPIWKQEVVDAEGRRRFHGAFTGGFSAGYYNTVGSAEGWAPAEFKSSRSSRNDAKAQTAEDFMDEDDLTSFGGKQLQTNPAHKGIAGARAGDQKTLFEEKFKMLYDGEKYSQQNYYNVDMGVRVAARLSLLVRLRAG